MVVYNHLGPNGGTHQTFSQSDVAVRSLLVLGGIWQHVQHCPSLQP